MIAEIAEIVGIANQVQKAASASNGLVDPGQLEASRMLFARAKSIAERAKAGIMQYPVVFSSSMLELGLVTPINKHLEVQYALFTLITAGLNPTTMTSVGNYIKNTFGSESFKSVCDAFGLESLKDVEADLKPATKDQKDNFAILAKNSMSAYESKNRSNDMSLETYGEPVIPGDVGQSGAPSMKLPGTTINANMSKASLDLGKTKTPPTIVNVQLSMGNNQNVTFPLAVKTVPHVISNEEMKTVFEYAIEDKNLLHRVVQLSSGEIAFFKDFVLQMDRAEKDTDMYRRMGRHPWYRQLIERKNLSKMKRGAQMMSIDKSVGDILPTCTLVCTKDEIAAASKMRYTFLLKNQKFLNAIVNKMFLLCLVVYDPDLDTVYFNYAGYDNPMMYHMKELKGSDGSVDLELSKAIADLVKRV